MCKKNKNEYRVKKKSKWSKPENLKKKTKDKRKAKKPIPYKFGMK